LQTNPVVDFLKFAGVQRVRAHVRTEQDGDKYQVVQYERNVPDAADEQRKVELRDKQGKEVALWKEWNEGGRTPEQLRPLLKSFRPMIQSKINVYKGKLKMVPDSAIEAEHYLRFVDALKSYDPSKGSLGTYVFRYLDKAKRFIVENQNVGRIPENRAYKIRIYMTVRDELSEELGRPPEFPELARRLEWDVAEVERMDSELRNDLVSQGFEEDPYSFTPSKSEETRDYTIRAGQGYSHFGKDWRAIRAATGNATLHAGDQLKRGAGGDWSLVRGKKEIGGSIYDPGNKHRVNYGAGPGSITSMVPDAPSVAALTRTEGILGPKATRRFAGLESPGETGLAAQPAPTPKLDVSPTLAPSGVVAAPKIKPAPPPTTAATKVVTPTSDIRYEERAGGKSERPIETRPGDAQRDRVHMAERRRADALYRQTGLEVGGLTGGMPAPARQPWMNKPVATSTLVGGTQVIRAPERPGADRSLIATPGSL